MEARIEKRISKKGKAYVGLWFENCLVTVDRRAIYKLVHKETIKQMSVGDIICFDIFEGSRFIKAIDDTDYYLPF